MNVSFKEKIARLSEEQEALKARNKKRAISKRTKKARAKAAQHKYYRSLHPTVQRSAKRAKQRREVAEVLRVVKQSMQQWEKEES